MHNKIQHFERECLRNTVRSWIRNKSNVESLQEEFSGAKYREVRLRATVLRWTRIPQEILRRSSLKTVAKILRRSRRWRTRIGMPFARLIRRVLEERSERVFHDTY